jgi:hypothetical protein
VVSAVLVDPSRLPALRPRRGYCPLPELQEVTEILDVLFDLYEDIEAVIDAGAVLNALGDSPARRRVVPLFEYASKARNPQDLFEGALGTLEDCDRSHAQDQHLRAISQLEARVAAGDSSATAELESLLGDFSQTYKDGAPAPSS